MDHGYGMGMVATKARREGYLSSTEGSFFAAVTGHASAHLSRSQSISSAASVKISKPHFSWKFEASQNSQSMSGWEHVGAEASKIALCDSRTDSVPSYTLASAFSKRAKLSSK